MFRTKSKTTINDVAELAGVSIKTVSRVVNHEQAVRSSTRKKVQKAIDVLGYQPNFSARNLASTHTYTLGVVYDNPNAYYVIDMQNGILSASGRLGYELIIHPCSAEADGVASELLVFAAQASLSGLILTPPFSEMPILLRKLKQAELPFVRVISAGSVDNIDMPCVYIQDKLASIKLTQHLIELGHKEIAFISGDKSHKSTTERLTGYESAMLDAGIEIEADWIFEGSYSFESGVKAAKQILTRQDRPTAFFCCNDEIAAGVLFTARQMGLKVPQDLAIVGFENSPFSQQTLPTLTTAAQPIQTIAETACEMLIEQIAGAVSVDSVAFEPKVIVRQSTKH